MTVVTETPSLGTVDPEYVAVEIYLAGQDGIRMVQPAVQISSGDTIVASIEVELDEDDGSWSEEIIPNTDISPAGTRWARRLRGFDVSPIPVFFNVPDSPTPVAFNTIITGAPGDITDDEALVAHAAQQGTPGGHLPGDTPSDGETIVWSTSLGRYVTVPVGAAAPDNANGTILVVNTIWVMDHNLGYGTAVDLNPSEWYFEDENGDPISPASIDYVNPNRATCSWLVPVRGTWRVN